MSTLCQSPLFNELQIEVDLRSGLSWILCSFSHYSCLSNQSLKYREAFSFIQNVEFNFSKRLSSLTVSASYLKCYYVIFSRSDATTLFEGFSLFFTETDESFTNCRAVIRSPTFLTEHSYRGSNRSKQSDGDKAGRT